MAERTFSSIKARRIRITKLDECGEPDDTVGNASVLVTSGFTKVSGTIEVEEGEEFLVKNAWGDLCVNEKDDSRIKRVNLEIEFCQVHPALLSMVAGGTSILDGSDYVGASFGESVGTNFQLEVWTKMAGTDCDLTTTIPYIYWAFPLVTGGVLGDFEMANSTMNLMMTAMTEGTPTAYGQGWFEPDYFLSALPAGQFFAFQPAQAAPPADTNGPVDYVAPTP
jgi:hypothetical protein